MKESILIIDFGSQYTQLIARKVREQNVFCEVQPYNHYSLSMEGLKGVIFSGSPYSVHNDDAPQINLKEILNQYPVLGICYGAQMLMHQLGGLVKKSDNREYGRAHLGDVSSGSKLLEGINNQSPIWMSHGDTISEVAPGFNVIAKTESIPVAAFESKTDSIYGVQFHPEVYHSEQGNVIIGNFLSKICACKGDWTPSSFVETTVEELKETLGNDKVVLGLSGGVDSSVAAMLLHKAIGKNLYCLFVNNGLLRKNEYAEVLEGYKGMGLNVQGVDSSELFYAGLNGISDPEEKRKKIGNTFIEVFDQKAKQIEGVKWLGQGTIYPDIIESVSVKGPSATIKSHHNVGGLPEKMHLKVIEPLKWLFKDEVRKVGKVLGISDKILGRHPFPGPGLAIRILGAITPEKVILLQEVDHIFISSLKEFGLYNDVWQAGAILLPVQSVGVMGDERTYESVVALRAVKSTDGMTADWCHLPYESLAKISNKIINQVKGVNRVTYDISSKPPATIEWE